MSPHLSIGQVFAGTEIIVTSAALADSEERLFPESPHRSPRILKKLTRRFGGEFRKVPAVWRVGDKIVMHPERYQEFKAKLRHDYDSGY